MTFSLRLLSLPDTAGGIALPDSAILAGQIAQSSRRSSSGAGWGAPIARVARRCVRRRRRSHILLDDLASGLTDDLY